MGNHTLLMGQPPPGLRLEARRELARVLKTASALDAFCLDHYDQAYRLFTRGMNREEKENILLERYEPNAILASLQKHEKKLSIQIDHLKPARPIGSESAKDIEETDVENAEQSHLIEQLCDLEEQRDRLDDQDFDTSYIVQEIRSIRRKLKQRPSLEKNNIFAKRYKLIEVVGRGGYSIVWSARDLQVKRRVAVKFLHPQYSTELSIVKRFNRGAKRMEQLADRARLANLAKDQDYCLVRVIEQPRQERGYVYFVMDYLEGGDLHNAILESKVKCEEAVNSVLQVGDLLHFAHQCGITHRDIKPDNILLTNYGRACLTDFDAVWALNTTSSITGNQHVGTVSYMPPEVLEQWDQAIRTEEADTDEQDSNHAMHAANVLRDIYSLGLTLAFVYAGKNLPPIMSQPEFQQRFLTQLQCPPTVRTAIARAIACDPSCRTKTVRDFCSDVRAGLHVHNRLGAAQSMRVADPHHEEPSLVRPMQAMRQPLPEAKLPATAPLLPGPQPTGSEVPGGAAPQSPVFTQILIKPPAGSPVPEATVLRIPMVGFEQTRPSIEAGWIDLEAAFPGRDALLPLPDQGGRTRQRPRWLWVAIGLCPVLLGLLSRIAWNNISFIRNRPPAAVGINIGDMGSSAGVSAREGSALGLSDNPLSDNGSLAAATTQNHSQRPTGPSKESLHPAAQASEQPDLATATIRLTPQLAYRLAVETIEGYRNVGNQFDRQCRDLGAYGAYIFDITLDADAHVASVYMQGPVSDSIKHCLKLAIENITFPKQLARQSIRNLDIVIAPR